MMDTTGASNLPSGKRPLPSRQTLGYPRKRSMKACRTCRLRKTKCNNERPICGFCRSLGAVCDYEDEVDVSALDPASQVIVQKIEELSRKIDEATVSSHKRLDDILGSQSGSQSGQQDVTANTRLNSPNAATVSSIDDGPLSGTKGLPTKFENELFIPPFQTAPDQVIAWPILKTCTNHENDYISNAQFENDFMEVDDFSRGEARGNPDLESIDEESIPDLVEIFLKDLHVQHPLLDAVRIRNYVSEIAAYGHLWDERTCLVLIACALGALGDASLDQVNARLYHHAALQRLGFLASSLCSIQCFFFFGIYELRIFRPLHAFKYFLTASSSLLIYLKSKAAYQLRNPNFKQSDDLERQEASLYWSCYGAICDLRSELPLSQSPLAEIDYPHVLPPPPTNFMATMGFPKTTAGVFDPYQGRLTALPIADATSRRKEEETWLYYMTSIIIHRLCDRILRTLYTTDHSSWSPENLNYVLQAVNEFECKVRHWYKALPVPLRFTPYESSTSTTEPHTHLQQLTYLLSLRIRLILFRPFLYYIIHHQSSLPPPPFIPPATLPESIFLQLPALSSEEVEGQIRDFASKAIMVCTEWILFFCDDGDTTDGKINGDVALDWRDARCVLTSALLLVAAGRGGVIGDEVREGWRTCARRAGTWLKDRVHPIGNGCDNDLLRGAEILEEQSSV